MTENWPLTPSPRNQGQIKVIDLLAADPAAQRFAERGGGAQGAHRSGKGCPRIFGSAEAETAPSAGWQTDHAVNVGDEKFRLLVLTRILLEKSRFFCSSVADWWRPETSSIRAACCRTLPAESRIAKTVS